MGRQIAPDCVEEEEGGAPSCKEANQDEQVPQEGIRNNWSMLIKHAVITFLLCLFVRENLLNLTFTLIKNFKNLNDKLPSSWRAN